MNAHQRRKAYCSIDRMAGKFMTYRKRNGGEAQVVVIGRTEPVSHLACSAHIDYAFNGDRPSIHRAKCYLVMGDGEATISPRLSQLRAF